MRDIDECIHLPLPSDVTAMMAAADSYLDQYGRVAMLHMRGTVRLEDGTIATIPTWRAIARFDRDLGLMGLGELEESDEDLLWAYPLGPGLLKIAALDEEH